MHWPHIDRYENVRSRLVNVPVRAKVKLHGTHGRIDVAYDHSVQAYSRHRLLTPETDDNFGFAAWAAQEANRFEPGTYYGEWYGPGIQRGVAISQVPYRCFAVFAAVIADTLIVEPDLLQHFAWTYILPWHSPLYADGSELDTAAINAEIDRIALVCPWAEAVHGITGPGEGLVFYNLNTSQPAFKVKAAAFTSHPGVRERPAVSPNVYSFIEAALHPARLEQAVQETGPRLPENTSAFLKWIGNDVKRECATELVASGLVWSDVAKLLARKASQWYLHPNL